MSVWRAAQTGLYPGEAILAARVYTDVYLTPVRFSWDARKSTQNLRARGFDLEFATQIFDDPTLERVDDRRDYGEPRVVALGVAQGIMLTVVYTDRVEAGGEINRRIISARKSSRREREAYNKHLGRT